MASPQPAQPSHAREPVPASAREIAHDLRNLLTAIRGRAELLVTTLGPGHPAAEDAAHVVVVAGTAFDLLDDLDGSGPADDPSASSDLDGVIRALGTVVRALASPHVELELELASGARVTIARRHLERVMLNLALNARDAMPEGGRLRVRTATHAEGHARITVTDTGGGFAEDALRHLFEPGFTTKRERGGSGRGLAGSRRIVEASGGTLHVTSRAGEGATVEIILPLAED
jgi:two-component system, cell cycle sensor histidine kinase and response regulator CckA